MSAIEEIYINTVKPSENSMKRDRAYIRAKNQTNQYYKHLCELLTEYQIILLDKLVASYSAKTERQNIHCFINGFKTGHSVALQAME
ncbi:MAG: hypothetical protein HFE49_08715 [Clostridia bacterium]|nr:hypothetical protein [Clostridia bacterium]